jgi:branched-chain amino acid transport system substrate-binding protein
MVKDLPMQTAVVMSEDAAWTIPFDEEYLKCLPTGRLKVLDHIRLSPDTTDFTPIFKKMEGEKPDVIVIGISYVACSPRCSGSCSRCQCRCRASPARPPAPRSGKTPTA